MRSLIKNIIKYPTILLNKIFLYFYYEFNRKGYYNRGEMFKTENNKVLFIAPHVDDETIGAGYTLLKHGERGDYIVLAYMADGGGATSELSREELIEERKNEAKDIQDKIGINELLFFDLPDGEVEVTEEAVEKLYKIIADLNPDYIYSPFLIDGHTDHVNSTRILIEALKRWNDEFKNIYLYEVNTRIKADKINNVVIMDKEGYIAKNELYKSFKSQYVMGFDAFNMVDRAKRYIIEEGYAIESFIRLDFKDLNDLNNSLIENKFNPNDYKQLSSRYNLIMSYIQNRKTKAEFLKLCKPMP